jgi:hypothetical protein
LISEVRLAQPSLAQNRFEDLYHPVGSQIIGSLSGKPHERVLREILRRLARILRIRRSNHAATMLQPEQYRAEHSRIRSQTKMRKTAQISKISYQNKAYQEYTDLTYKEEVAGSNPASPTLNTA